MMLKIGHEKSTLHFCKVLCVLCYTLSLKNSAQ